MPREEKQNMLPKEIVIDSETTGKNPHKAEPLGVALYIDNIASYKTGKPELLLSNAYIIGHNAKYDAVVLRRAGYPPFRIDFDTIIAHYILHIDEPRKLETLAKKVLKWDKKTLLDIFNDYNTERFNKELGKKFATRKNLPDPKKNQGNWYEDYIDEKGKLRHFGVPNDVIAEYAKEDVKATAMLKPIYQAELEKRPELLKWFNEVEMPYVNILIESELMGVAVDVAEARQLKKNLEEESEKLKVILHRLCGRPDANFNSPPQLQDILFNFFKLKPVSKTKTGWSTDADALEELAEKHVFPKLLLEYRGIEKLLGTYVEPILEQGTTGDCRVHTVFNQTLTRTRRLSSKEPNLQNIPARSKLGKLLRRCFTASPGRKFLDADYSQMEPRLAAHFSGDEALIQIYKNNEDLYLRSVDIMKEKSGKEIDRAMAKQLWLSVLYQKTAYGLSQDWACSETEAAEIMLGLMIGFPLLNEYIQEQKFQAHKTNGWCKTLAGLPVYVGNINSSNKWEVAKCERRAVNYRIQGSSQDVIKKAEVDIREQTGNIAVLRVHDQLLFDTATPEEDSKIIIPIMENAWKLKVPLKVEFKITERWEK